MFYNSYESKIMSFRDATAKNKTMPPHYQWVSKGVGMMLNTDMCLYKVLYS